MESSSAISVAQLNKYIKTKIDQDKNLSDVWVKAEISNFTNHYKSGHFYLSLKDETSLIRAVMFSFNASKVVFKPEDGMKVLCRGRVSVFERDGQYQFYIEEMIADGIGALYIAYEQLKAKLESEGLFEQSHKLNLPKIPLSVGVITSPTGAAVRDIINVCTRRFPLAEINLYPVLVQGDKAAASLVEAVEYFNNSNMADVIIIGRGGGSIEDLWAFNDETLARTVYNSHIPIISAVGHETDFTICDFVADLRAPTPSAAAELCVPDSVELIAKFDNLKHKVLILLTNLLKMKKQQLSLLTQRRVLTNPEIMYQEKKMELDHYISRADGAIKLTFNGQKNRFSSLLAKLEALNPIAVLSRGYAYSTSNGCIVKSVEQLKQGDIITTDFKDGKIESEIKTITKR